MRKIPARKKFLRKSRGQTKIKFFGLIFILVFLVLFLVYLFKNITWVGDSKLNLVINSPTNIFVAVFNPEGNELTTIEIPGKVEVAVSRKLGIWKLESVWQLGENEKLDGKLLSETIVKNFRIPVTAWADSQATPFIKKGNIARAVLGKYETNLTLADKIRLFIFSMQVKEIRKTYINLSQTSFLREKRLLDGEMGYEITDIMPEKVILAAADNLIVKNNIRLLLINATQNTLLPEKIGEIIQAMGAKVALVKNLKEEGGDCTVWAKDSKIGKSFADVFGCSMSKESTSENFDVEIKIGKAFESRF